MDLKTKLEVYEGTRKLLSDPKHWRKGMYASRYKRLQDQTEIRDEEAKCFCLVGGLARVIYEKKLVTSTSSPSIYEYQVIGAAKGMCDELAECVPNLSHQENIDPPERVIFFNDDRKTKHEDVLNALDCAIEATRTLLQKEGFDDGPEDQA